jgi:LDH2 family malate/lactate/ureidoglycolate dehydrogenase
MATPLPTHRAQIELILSAWGFSAAATAATADVLAWADLHGIDSHGISMLTMYDDWRRAGRLDPRAEPRILRQSPVSALVDGGGGLGHWPGRFAMQTAIDKAAGIGMAAVAVRNSAHYGACGYYALMAAERGLIGITTTTTSGARVAPTRAAEAKLGTDPWCFAAPGAPGQPFLLDMATTTVAFGKIRNKANEGISCPPGWLLDAQGQPSTDANDAVSRGGFLTPLGGTPEGSSHKGYGLAAMVNILAACLSGATVTPHPAHGKSPGGMGIGHFFLALDPGLFREAADFRAEVAAFCDLLRAATPADPAQPVLVAGDPERAVAACRGRAGITIAAGLGEKLRAIAAASGAPWLLD